MCYRLCIIEASLGESKEVVRGVLSENAGERGEKRTSTAKTLDIELSEKSRESMKEVNWNLIEFLNAAGLIFAWIFLALILACQLPKPSTNNERQSRGATIPATTGQTAAAPPSKPRSRWCRSLRRCSCWRRRRCSRRRHSRTAAPARRRGGLAGGVAVGSINLHPQHISTGTPTKHKFSPRRPLFPPKSKFLVNPTWVKQTSPLLQ